LYLCLLCWVFYGLGFIKVKNKGVIAVFILPNISKEGEAIKNSKISEKELSEHHFYFLVSMFLTVASVKVMLGCMKEDKSLKITPKNSLDYIMGEMDDNLDFCSKEFIRYLKTGQKDINPKLFKIRDSVVGMLDSIFQSGLDYSMVFKMNDMYYAYVRLHTMLQIKFYERDRRYDLKENSLVVLMEVENEQEYSEGVRKNILKCISIGGTVSESDLGVVNAIWDRLERFYYTSLKMCLGYNLESGGNE